MLGFAQLILPTSSFPSGFKFETANPQKFNFPITELSFIGLLALIDPPKITVPPAILKFRRAGVKIIMVTGDQPPTAATIGRQVNIIPENAKTAEDIVEDYEARGEYITIDEAREKCDAIVIHGDVLREQSAQDKAKGLSSDHTLLKWLEKPYVIFARASPN